MPETTYCLDCEDETTNKDSICEFCRCAECGTAEKQKLTQDAFKCLDPHCQAINIYNQSTRTFEVAVDSLGQIQRFCSGCKRTLEHSDEKTAGECRRCMGDAI